jgi:hypothetical protein
MPIRSKRQWGFLFATGKPFARRWARETPGGTGARFRNLPTKVAKKEAATAPLAVPAHGPGGLLSTPGLGGTPRHRRWGKRLKATRIVGNLFRSNTGQFSSGGDDSTPAKKPTKAPKKNDAPAAADASAPAAAPPKQTAAQRAATAAARRERSAAEQATRDEESTTEQAARDGEDAQLAGAKTPKERQALRQQIATARRARAAELRKARRERSTAERAARSAEDAAPGTAAAAKPEKPKKGGGGGGKGPKAPKPEDPAKAAAAATREQERAARAAETAKRRAATDQRIAATEQRRQQADAQRSETQQRQLTDLTQRAASGTSKLSDSEWQHLIVSGMAERRPTGLFLTPAGQQQTTRQPQQVKASAGAGAFQVFKASHGQYRWISISSSAFEDRDEEIVCKAALASDCDRADADGDYGPLRWWHLPGVDIGDCDFNAMSGRCLIEMGTFRSAAVARAAQQAAPDLELSLGFKHYPDEPVGGVFSYIRRFERSLVPRGRVSNLLTSFAVAHKEPRMDPAKLKTALEKLGTSPEARAVMETIIAEAQTREKAADEAGLAFKDAPPWAQALIGRIDALEEAFKAPMDALEMLDAGTTEAADGEADMADGEGDDADAGYAIGDMTRDEFKALMGEVLNELGGKLSTMDAELKAMGYERRMKAHEAGLAAIGKQVEAILTTVKELNGDAPAGRHTGHKASEDNDDLPAELAELFKDDGDDLDLSPLGQVAAFLTRPVTA